MCTRDVKSTPLPPPTGSSKTKSEGLERDVACGFLLVGLLLGILVPMRVGAQTTQVTETLTSPNSEKGGVFGSSLAAVGDLNGDGTPDLLVGAGSETAGGREGGGRAYLFDGVEGELLRTLTSPVPKAWGAFGRSLAGVADLNGDGAPDLLVGARKEWGPSATEEAGRAFLFDGAGGEELRTLTSPNSEKDGWFGSSLAGLGDVSGDGTPDLLVGAYNESARGTEEAGRAYLFDGAEGEVLDTLTSPNPENDGGFGVSLAGVGDLNGDGTPDLLVGAPYESPGGTEKAGRAYLFDGARGEVLDTLTSPNPEQLGYFGDPIAAVGDVTGDGTPNVLVGAFRESARGTEEAGRVYLFDGAEGEVLDTLTSPNPEEGGFFGASFASVGDVSGDGTPDLLVGAQREGPGSTRGAGRAYLFDGAGGELLRTLTSPNPEKFGQFGYSLAGGVDLTGDGTPDLLVGAVGESSGGTEKAGRVYRFDVQLDAGK